MRAPAVFKPPIELEIAVPTEDEMLTMAMETHEQGTEWVGQIGEWAGHYSPAHASKVYHVDPIDDQPPQPTKDIQHSARFWVGTPLLWDAEVVWEGGCPHLHYSDKGQTPTDQLPLFADLPDLIEGSVTRIESNHYERNRKARAKCIQHYKPVCVCCGVDFGKLYGPLAEGFIHVHHLKPVSEIAEAYSVDPINDLRPICPNCHSVIHLREIAYSIDEVRAMLGRDK